MLDIEQIFYAFGNEGSNERGEVEMEGKTLSRWQKYFTACDSYYYVKNSQFIKQFAV